MKIKELKANGFRSLKQVTWMPGDLNVIIGANGTGKSNLLRFLELISVAAKGGLGKYIQSSGGMGALSWDGQATAISFILDTNPHENVNEPERYELNLARLGMGSAYRIDHELLANYFRVRAGEMPRPFKSLERNGQRAVIFDQQERALVAPPESVPEDETLLSIATGPFINNRHIPLFQEYLASIAVYHNLRVDRDAVIRHPAVARAEMRVDPDGQNLIPVLHTLYTGNRNFRKSIDAAMRAAFGDDFEELVFSPAADQRIQLRVQWSTLNHGQSAADLSDGTLRFLFLLTVLASPSPAPIIAIDEPETGLHPSMLPIIAEYAVDASLRTQVVFTTHSPQFLDAFTETRPTTTVTKWQAGATTFQTLGGDELNYWLQEYTLGALFKSGELERMI
ncbi:MAG: AAA family ATPase [Acidobacteriota bacterium]|nr:AAA family ATPase [Acidobacteriota bacterium]